MTCQELLDRLVDYYGGELEIEEHRTIEIHLSGCQTCVRATQSYHYTMRLARALPRCDRLPADVETRLRTALASHLSGERE